MVETIRWLLTVVLAAFAVGLGAFNWRAFWVHGIRERGEPSAVPLVAAVLGILALFTCPLEGSGGYWWVPLALDFGSVPYAFWLAYAAASRRP
jgi:hypothetical protein